MMVYTGRGDKGKTSNFSGATLDKDDLEIEVYGTYDELLAFLGYAYSKIDNDALKRDLLHVMNDIHNLLADLGKPKSYIGKAHSEWLESKINEYSKILKPLNTFILEASNDSSAIINIARAVARRAERRLVSLSKVRDVNEYVLMYANRLSDYLFVLFRYLNAVADVEEITYEKYEEGSKS